MAPTAPSAAAFASWIIQEGGLPEEKVLAAVARQVVYGGSLDTALLESGVASVEELWALLSRATGLAIPPVALVAPRTWGEIPVPVETSDRCRAVPAALREDGVLQLLCSEPVAWDELQELSTRLGKTFELFIAPEVHVEALRSALFGRPMSARLAKLWMRLVGRSGLRTRPVPRHRADAVPGALPGIFGDTDVTLPGGVARPVELATSTGEAKTSHDLTTDSAHTNGSGAHPAALTEANAHEEDAPASENAREGRRRSRQRPRHSSGTAAGERGRAELRTTREPSLPEEANATGEEHEPNEGAATPLLAVMALEDVTHPNWAGGNDEADDDEGDDDAHHLPARPSGPAPASADHVPDSLVAGEPQRAVTGATAAVPANADARPSVAQERETTREAAAVIDTTSRASGEPATSDAGPLSSPAREPGVTDSFDWQSDTTPEAPYALTLDFEAEPPIANEATEGDEARARAMAWETFSATEALCRRARDVQDPGRTLALRALRRRLAMPPVPSLRRHLVALLDGGGPLESMRALADLTEMRDREAVPAIVPLLDASDKRLAAAARQALMLLTLQDFGHKMRKWEAWWNAHRSLPATAWLFAGLSHKDAPIRLAAAEELRQITGAYFGYHFDLPKRDREDAKQRWQTWWDAMAEHERDEAEG